MKHFFICVFLLSSVLCFGQRIISAQIDGMMQFRYQENLPSDVIFYDGFENSSIPGLPQGWTTQSLASVGFVAGTGGSASGQANENGFWAVPFHGIFAMANDDVCNCDKSKDRLTSPIINLKIFDKVTLKFSAYQNGSGGQTARIEAKTSLKPWTTIANIPSSSTWKTQSVEIPKSFLDDGFQFRFYYDDGGNYASGLAIDDVYLIEGTSEIFSLAKFYSIEGDNLGSGQMFETLPLSQAREAKFQFGIQVDNDTPIRKNARLKVNAGGPVTYDKTSSNWMIGQNSQKAIYLHKSSSFTPYELGTYTVNAILETDSLDIDLSDNIYSQTFSVVDSVYSHVASTPGNATGIWVQGSGDRYGTVFHFHSTDTIVAMNVRIHPSTDIGARFKVEIFEFDSINEQPLFTSLPFEVEEQHLGMDFRLPLNVEINKGKHLITFKKEVGSLRLVIGASNAREARDSNVVYKPLGQPWKDFPYFPKSSLIFKSLDTNCLGHIEYTLTNESCPNINDGAIVLNPIGMSGSLSYNWSTAAGNVSSISNLSPGNYAVTVLDDSSCDYSTSFNIDSATALKIDPIILPDSCQRHTGSIDLKISQGQQPYTVSWNSDTLSSAEYGLSSGNYSVEISDDNGCALDTVLSISGTALLSASFQTTEANCQVSDGSIVALVNGTEPITFSWNTGATDSTLQNIEAGIYTLLITDSLGCSLEDTIILNNINAPSINITAVGDVDCFDQFTGSVDATISGGTAPYVVSWNNGSSTEDLINVHSGKYSITVNDNDLCQSFALAEVRETSSPINISFNAKKVYCLNDSSGAAEAIVNGGQSDYMFQWSNGVTSNFVENLVSGVYTISVTDDLGCELTEEITINTGLPFFVLLDSTVWDTASGFFPGNDLYVSIYGGISPLDYIWNDSIMAEDLINVPTDTYRLAVTDQLGCLVIFEYFLENGPASIQEIQSEFKFEIYPNPASQFDELHFRSDLTINKILIYNTFGQLVDQQDLNRTEGSIDISSLRSGIYFIEALTPFGRQILPFAVN